MREKKADFLNSYVFKKTIVKDKIKYAITFVFTIIVLSVLSFFVVPLFIDKSTMATSQFSGQGVSALIPCLIYAFLQTGFSEELFFRGFLTKGLYIGLGLK